MYGASEKTSTMSITRSTNQGRLSQLYNTRGMELSPRNQHRDPCRFLKEPTLLKKVTFLVRLKHAYTLHAHEQPVYYPGDQYISGRIPLQGEKFC